MVTIATHTGSKLSQSHNIRGGKTSKDGHIDPSKTAENETICHETIKSAYRRLFDTSIAEYNAKQKRRDRRIGNYYEKIKDDKQKHVAYEMIIGVYNKSDKQTGKVIEALREVDDKTSKEILKEFVAGWKHRNPNLELIGAYYHADEAQPHMHLVYIPIVRDCKRGPSIQTGLDKALQNQGFKPGKDKWVTAQVQWEARENQVLEDLCRVRGLNVEHPQRDSGKKTYHKSTPVYKELQADKAELEAVKKQISQGKAEIKEIKAELPELRKDQKRYANVKGFMSKVKRFFGLAFLPAKLLDNVNENYELMVLERSDLRKTLSAVQDSNKALTDENQTQRGKIEGREREIQKLKTQLKENSTQLEENTRETKKAKSNADNFLFFVDCACQVLKLDFKKLKEKTMEMQDIYNAETERIRQENQAKQKELEKLNKGLPKGEWKLLSIGTILYSCKLGKNEFAEPFEIKDKEWIKAFHDSHIGTVKPGELYSTSGTYVDSNGKKRVSQSWAVERDKTL